MRRVLYLVSEPSSDVSLVPTREDQTTEASVVLIEEAVGRRDLPGHRVSALAEDATARQIVPAYPTLSSRDLLRMIFESDSVVTL